MVVDKINVWLTSENKNLEEGMQWLYQQEYAQLSGWSFKRQFLTERKESSGDLRFSSAGKCVRALSYGLHKFEVMGKEVDSRGMRTFFIGDMTEIMVVLLAKVSGVPIFGYGVQQPRIKMTVYGKEIFGHPDGFLIDEFGILLLEVKSMNDMAFNRFEKSEIEESHIFQMNANMDAAGVDRALYIAFNKNNSILSERVVHKDPAIVSQIHQRFLSVLASTPESLPERPFAPNEKGFLPWNCLYCGYNGHCWPEAKKVLVKNAYKLMIPMEIAK
jgi:hypothetical protein